MTKKEAMKVKAEFSLRCDEYRDARYREFLATGQWPESALRVTRAELLACQKLRPRKR